MKISSSFIEDKIDELRGKHITLWEITKDKWGNTVGTSYLADISSLVETQEEIIVNNIKLDYYYKLLAANDQESFIENCEVDLSLANLTSKNLKEKILRVHAIHQFLNDIFIESGLKVGTQTKSVKENNLHRLAETFLKYCDYPNVIDIVEQLLDE